MQFSPDDVLTPNQILADVLLEVNDEDTKTFNKGWYISQIQQVMEELSFDTFFHELFLDFAFPNSNSLRLKIPKGAFNVKNIFLFNGDNCEVDAMKNVYIKRGYFTRGENKGTMMNKKGIQDPFIGGYSDGGDVYFASMQNGYIYFSEACAGYETVRIYFNGIFGDIGDAPSIPRHFRQVVKAWVVLQVYRIMMSRIPRTYAPLYDRMERKLYRPFDGLWDTAQLRVKAIDSKFRKDMGEYLSRGNW